MNAQDFRSLLGKKLETLDRAGAKDAGAKEVCEELISEIYRTPEPFDEKILGKIMQDLRNKHV